LLIVDNRVLLQAGTGRVNRDPESHKPGHTKPDYRHAYPVFLILFGVLAAAMAVRAWLVPASFGKYGYYRGDALDEARERPSLYAGKGACAGCHDDIVALHAKDAHGTVQCETCHGAASKHAVDGENPPPRADQQKDCLVCHRRMDARPGSFPQINREEHYKFVGVADPETPCVRCHSGHEPVFMDKDLRTARLHPLIHSCSDCHLGRTDQNQKKPEDHPQIFTCNYCHPAVAASAAKAEHHSISCRTCHFFIKQNAFSGRIVRDADPRFCLLCHRKTEFRTTNGPPLIDWPGHLAGVSDGPPDPKRTCVECHQDQIHALFPREVSP
jgi:transcription elongation factor Elf1